VFGFGIGEALLIGVALTLLFGARKIPLLARGMGAGIRNFKGELKGDEGNSGQDTPADGGGRGDGKVAGDGGRERNREP